MNDQILELSNEELEVVAGGGSAPATLSDVESAAANLKTFSLASELQNTPFGSEQFTALSATDATSKAHKNVQAALP